MATPPIQRRSSNTSMYSSYSSAPQPTSSMGGDRSGTSVTGSTSRRRAPLGLSPAGLSYMSTPDSHSGSKYAASTSSSRPISPRYLSFSSAASNSGSVATTATAAGPTRFKRGHNRKKAPAIIGVKTANPDEVDLMALEDPDEVFRRFGVRDVRGLEKRANDAAAAKVAELRTMVGERYRDLLSAADSIIRMRTAAEKLVEKFERIESGISLDGEAGPDDTPTKRKKPPRITHRASTGPTKPERSFSSPPTLSLTIQLFLTIPSTVHGLLESGSFLAAARLEGIGRVIYRELSTYTSEGEEQNIKTSFPIIESQWEVVSGLGSAITRRAIADLQTWSTTSLATAKTLATILMLENASLPSSLATLLEARSKTLTTILSSSTTVTSKKLPDVGAVLKHLNEALRIVLQTVEAASTIFGASTGDSDSRKDGLLLQILREVESPSATADDSSDDNEILQLIPILRTLPNYPLLARHLPASVLDFTPFLSIDSSRNAFPPSAANEQIQAWLSRETERVVQGITSWIAHLRGGAQTLALVRSAVHERLPLPTKDQPTLRTDVTSLRSSLDAAIEARFEQVYLQHLTTLVDRVEPALSNSLQKLTVSLADLDTAEFLFETPLAFPRPSHYTLIPHMSSRGTNALHAATDAPFESFLEQVTKRVAGRTPLIDRALSELEAHARELRKDLQGWLEGDEHGGEARQRLRQVYTVSAGDTLRKVYEALASVLNHHIQDVDASLFLGNFAHLLSKSKTFARDLLLGSAPLPKSQEGQILGEWRSSLYELQAHSLENWRSQAIERAVQKIDDATNTDSLRGTTSRAREAARALTNGAITSASFSTIMPLPHQPSPAILSALRNLVTSVRKVGLHRTESDPSIVQTLLEQVAGAALPVVKRFLHRLQQLDDDQTKRDFATQVVWDVSFLGRIWGTNTSQEWQGIRQQLLEIADPALSPSIDSSTMQYLQRTQTVFASLLTPVIIPSQSEVGSDSGWLPLGPSASSNETVSLVGLVKPGPRLGLLPTRS